MDIATACQRLAATRIGPVRGERALRPVQDSRVVTPGDTFFACHPDPVRRAAHVAAAGERGAAAVVLEPEDHGLAGPGLGALIVPAVRAAYAQTSAWCHGLDRRCPSVLAVTGTDGKTSTVWCAWHALGPGAARVGTLGLHDGGTLVDCANTTPGPDQLHPFLAGLDPATVPGVALEASSIGLDQGRLSGVPCAAVVHTGLGHDHLDYHRDRAAYAASKLRLLDHAAPGALAVYNADDPACAAFARSARDRGLRVCALGLQLGASRVTLADGVWVLHHEAQAYRLAAPAPGGFNAWNAAAGALIAAAATGEPLARVCERLHNVPPVPGRLELIRHDPRTYVDYAHTPDAIRRVIAVLREAHPTRRLVCVFGCGGDRDRAKRGPMGDAALSADHAVLTTDNARSEDPAAIAAEVAARVDPRVRVACEAPWPDAGLAVVLDRGEAIRLARRIAGVDGVVVVCGKGHETWQEIGGTRLDWDDRRFIRDLEPTEPIHG
ncbi:MAG: Mur ligase family protein [Planctomycetota bacterium]